MRAAERQRAAARPSTASGSRPPRSGTSPALGSPRGGVLGFRQRDRL